MSHRLRVQSSNRSEVQPNRGRLAAALIGVLGVLAAGLIGPAAPVANAAYPGSDGRIAFTRSNQIYTIKADGTGIKQLTTGAKNYRPRYSPDGTRIAYINETAAGARDIWVMSAAGLNKQRVTQVGTVTTAPAWSPNGANIAFASSTAGSGTWELLQRIKSTAPFGSPTLFLGNFDNDTTYDDVIPVNGGGSIAWSPDGNHIMLNSDNYPNSPDHYIVDYNVDTHHIDEWANVGGSCCGFGNFGDVTWSASGSRIGYIFNHQRQNGGPGPNVGHRIVVDLYPSHGSSAFATTINDKQLAFSPSGNRVALMNDSGGTAKIYITGFDGSNRRFLTNGYHPDWQPLP